jgi:tripartite-type tricarboxylate transporter receptor subunit TctC
MLCYGFVAGSSHSKAGFMAMYRSVQHVLAAVAAGVALAAASALPVRAQAFPSQPVKIVVPFTAGGGVDQVARIIAPKLSELLGQPVVIENRGGAGASLGAAAVASAPPDGYTLLFGTGSTHGTNSSVYPKLSYDPVRDFVPVVQVTTSPLVLIVPPELPVKSVEELIALARSKPGEFSFASYGTGSINHLSAELFNAMAGIQANHIPYRGAAPALTDLMAGRIHYTFDGVATSLGYAHSGKIRILGVAGPKRSPVIPDTPTITEKALPGFETVVWFGLFAPAKTPAPAVALINRKVNELLAMPSIQESFTKLGIEGVGGTPEALAARVKFEMDKWAKLVRERNLRFEQ